MTDEEKEAQEVLEEKTEDVLTKLRGDEPEPDPESEPNPEPEPETFTSLLSFSPQPFSW